LSIDILVLEFLSILLVWLLSMITSFRAYSRTKISLIQATCHAKIYEVMMIASVHSCIHLNQRYIYQRR